MEPVRCPHCGESKAVLGVVSDRQGPAFAHAFVPAPLRPLRMAEGVVLQSYACASCGMVWSRLDPTQLRGFIEKHGDELARQHLDKMDRGPYRDLPDTSLAREIGDMVAEFDALAREGKGIARRYREIRGVTWDQAIKVTGNWAGLTRAEKLALLGWEPKKKAIVDDLDAPFP